MPCSVSRTKHVGSFYSLDTNKKRDNIEHGSGFKFDVLKTCIFKVYIIQSYKIELHS